VEKLASDATPEKEPRAKKSRFHPPKERPSFYPLSRTEVGECAPKNATPEKDPKAKKPRPEVKKCASDATSEKKPQAKESRSKVDGSAPKNATPEKDPKKEKPGSDKPQEAVIKEKESVRKKLQYGLDLAYQASSRSEPVCSVIKAMK